MSNHNRITRGITKYQKFDCFDVRQSEYFFCSSLFQGRMWWCFGCYFCLPILFTILCQMATRNVNSDSSSAQKQRNHDDHSSSQKRQQHQAVERQLNCTLLALAVVYGVCALPEHVCNITLAYTHITVSEDTASMLALLHHFLLFFKSSVTPVLLLCLCKVSQRVKGTQNCTKQL